MNLLLLIGLICASYLWAGNIDFIEDIKNLTWFGEKKKRKFKGKFIDYIYNFIFKLFNCHCVGFWITWGITGNIWLGFIVYVGAELLTSIIDFLKNNTFYG